jgi:protein O-GlcNAc transferase
MGQDRKHFDRAGDGAIAEALALAIARHERVDRRQAMKLCRLALQKDRFSVLHYFGVLEAQRGAYEQADRLIAHAVTADPASAEARLNHANVLSALGRHDEALSSVDRALALRPDYAQALNSRGAILLDLGRPEDALASLDQAEAVQPGYPEAINNRGNVLRELKRHEEALADYERAVHARPDFPDALSNRGIALLELRRPGDALESCDRALAVDPGHADAMLGRGTALRDLGRHREAVECYDRVLAVRPALAEARCNRGMVFQELGRFEEARDDYRRLIETEPRYDYAHGHLMHARLHCCDWAHYDEGVARLTGLVRSAGRAALPFEFLPVSASPADELKCATTYVADKYPAAPSPVWQGKAYGHGRIRVAYLSAYFHVHAMTRLMAGVFESHDKARFETTAISYGPDSSDEMRTRVRAAFDRFVDARGKSARETAQLLRELEIDIAVDVDGHTANARTAILAHRGAPIQVSYIGYPGTLGASYVDYILADRVVIPADHESCYAENVVCLPDCYQANDFRRPLPGSAPRRTDVGLPETGFVYCSFNNNYKISPGIFDAWMRILRQVDRSVLWLVEDNQAAGRNLRKEASRRGIAPERLIFAPRTGIVEHLARTRLAGLFLDTLPYGAHTTASDALWMGVPVLTCLGPTFAGRVAASLLSAAGLPELVTRDLGEYETLAVRLGRDDSMLREVVARLAANRASCPLFDTVRMTRHIEAAYVTMWERQRSGEPPAGFSVPAISG